MPGNYPRSSGSKSASTLGGRAAASAAGRTAASAAAQRLADAGAKKLARDALARSILPISARGLGLLIPVVDVAVLAWSAYQLYEWFTQTLTDVTMRCGSSSADFRFAAGPCPPAAGYSDFETSFNAKHNNLADFEAGPAFFGGRYMINIDKTSVPGFVFWDDIGEFDYGAAVERSPVALPAPDATLGFHPAQYPSIFPWALPIQAPAPVARPLPWRVVPHIGDDPFPQGYKVTPLPRVEFYTPERPYTGQDSDKDPGDHWKPSWVGEPPMRTGLDLKIGTSPWWRPDDDDDPWRKSPSARPPDSSLDIMIDEHLVWPVSPHFGPDPLPDNALEPQYSIEYKAGFAPRRVRPYKPGVPARGDRHIKPKSNRGVLLFLVLVNLASEARDLSNALYWALPQLKTKSGKLRPKYSAFNDWQRFKALLDHGDEVDVVKAIQNVVTNNLTDYIAAGSGKANASLQNQLDKASGMRRPIGVGTQSGNILDVTKQLGNIIRSS